jgi:hypothetical protein
MYGASAVGSLAIGVLVPLLAEAIDLKTLPAGKDPEFSGSFRVRIVEVDPLLLNDGAVLVGVVC